MRIDVLVKNTQLRRGKAAILAKNNPLLMDGELCYESDMRKLKVGDGVRRYNDLSYVESEGSSPQSGDGGITEAQVRAIITEILESASEDTATDAEFDEMLRNINLIP